MRLLLDTHVFLWYLTDDPRLPTAFRSAIREPANDVFLSVVSVWEIAVKVALKRLPLADRVEKFVPQQRALHGISSLELDEQSVFHFSRLPALHRDPFDRMLVCQSISSGMPIVTPDFAISAYPVQTLW